MATNNEQPIVDENTMYTWIETLAKVHAVPIEQYWGAKAPNKILASCFDWFRVFVIYVTCFDDSSNPKELEVVLNDLKTVDYSKEEFGNSPAWIKWINHCETARSLVEQQNR